MTNSTENSYDETQYFLLLAPFAILISSCLLIQLFIVVENIIDWLKRRSITGADKIITTLGISRIIFHTACLLHCFSAFFVSKFPEIFFTLTIVVQTSVFSNLWLSTLLSVFFYFSISTSQNVFFLRLKAIILKRVSFLIITSVLLSLGYSTISFMVTFKTIFRNLTKFNITIIIQQQKLMTYSNVLWSIFPLLMFFTASALLINLLFFHERRMNNCGNAMSSTATYHRTMKFTVFSFMTCVFYTMLHVFEVYVNPSNILCLHFIRNIFPVLQSVLLIYVTAKLRNQFFRIVHCGTDWWFNRNPPGLHSGEPVEAINL